ncbi:DUF433 domain-containing protein [Nannocystis radixulma]|uniref:DUF433 domain-containing protein n=1 Tax=Nannocystis radixulma TaxID=2995305 RepID=A0ABT5B090_9BACT|nr:DUF433 domain-containing protein [Nannocystis radixulma]MDC0666893.1 DUF433 domain-containing protein [Nannocystis radixulma]
MTRRTDIYGGTDPADVPAYPLAEAALLVGVPVSTLRNWTRGRSFPTKQGRRTSSPIIKTPEPYFLSFTNIVEAHVLAGLRKEHRIALDKIRDAVRYVEKNLKVEHALARRIFKVDGVDLFVDRLGGLLNASRGGQTALRAVLEEHLKRVEYQRDRAVKFYPLHREGAPRLIVVDPRRAFGRPTLAGTSVPIGDIKARFQAGDDVDELAADYRVPATHIQEALRASPAEAA